MTEFQRELTELLNRHSKENASNTPDFLLAGFLIDSLNAFDNAVAARQRWHAGGVIPAEVTEAPSPKGETQ